MICIVGTDDAEKFFAQYGTITGNALKIPQFRQLKGISLAEHQSSRTLLKNHKMHTFRLKYSHKIS